MALHAWQETTSAGPGAAGKEELLLLPLSGNKRQFLAEDVLQKLEDDTLPILNRLRNTDFALDRQDRLTFAGYVALSYTRVPTFERS